MSSYQDAEYAVDFIVYSRLADQLFVLKNGECIEVQSAYLGNKTAMEHFQQQISAPDQLEATTIGIAQMPLDKDTSDENERYARCLDAFQATLRSNDGTYGGICVPFCVTSSKIGYQAHAGVVRAAVVANELGIDGKGTIGFQDEYNGSFQFIIAGGINSFSIHYPGAQFGCVYPGFADAKGFELIGKSNVDPYDFTHFAAELGVDKSISTWTNTPNDCSKSCSLFHVGEVKRGKQILDDSIKSLSKKIARQNDGWPASIDLDTIPELLQRDTVLTVSDILHLQMILQSLKLYYQIVSDKSSEDACSSQLITWTNFMNDAKFSIQPNSAPHA